MRSQRVSHAMPAYRFFPNGSIGHWDDVSAFSRKIFTCVADTSSKLGAGSVKETWRSHFSPSSSPFAKWENVCGDLTKYYVEMWKEFTFLFNVEYLTRNSNPLLCVNQKPLKMRFVCLSSWNSMNIFRQLSLFFQTFPYTARRGQFGHWRRIAKKTPQQQL